MLSLLYTAFPNSYKVFQIFDSKVYTLYSNFVYHFFFILVRDEKEDIDMAVERINLSTKKENLSINTMKTNEKQQNNPIITKALELGINVEAYYTYNENNECTGIDTVKLNAAIQEAMQVQNLQSNKNGYQDDTFEITTGAEKKTEEEIKTEAKNSQNNIDTAYTEAAVKYADSLNQKAKSTSEEGKLTSQWDSLQAEAYKLTSSTISNTTVLEGVKEFITNLTNLINTTKNYNAEKENEKESSLSLETAGDIEDKNNTIEVYEANIFTSNPFKSAFETFIEEDEEIAV